MTVATMKTIIVDCLIFSKSFRIIRYYTILFLLTISSYFDVFLFFFFFADEYWTILCILIRNLLFQVQTAWYQKATRVMTTRTTELKWKMSKKCILCSWFKFSSLWSLSDGSCNIARLLTFLIMLNSDAKSNQLEFNVKKVN